MPVDRKTLKTAIAAMLDSLATEHPLKHQNAYARRYQLESRSGRKLEIMFEQSPKTPASIWILQSAAGALATTKITSRESAGSSLYTKTGKTGKVNYGRHSALENMPRLGKADLLCLQPECLKEAGEILDTLPIS